jgi:hypothetical protein
MIKFQLDYKVSHPRQQQHATWATSSTITHYATGPDARRLLRPLLNYLSISLTCATAVNQQCGLVPDVTSTSLDDKKQSGWGSQAELSNQQLEQA